MLVLKKLQEKYDFKIISVNLKKSCHKSKITIKCNKEDKSKIIVKPIFKDTYDMPILEDLYYLLEKDNNTKIFAIKLIPFVKGSLKFLILFSSVFSQTVPYLFLSASFSNLPAVKYLSTFS